MVEHPTAADHYGLLLLPFQSAAAAGYCNLHLGAAADCRCCNVPRHPSRVAAENGHHLTMKKRIENY